MFVLVTAANLSASSTARFGGLFIACTSLLGGKVGEWPHYSIWLNLILRNGHRQGYECRISKKFHLKNQKDIVISAKMAQEKFFPAASRHSYNIWCRVPSKSPSLWEFPHFPDPPRISSAAAYPARRAAVEPGLLVTAALQAA